MCEATHLPGQSGYRLETGPRGKLILRVFYDPKRRDWDRQTEKAVKATGIDRRATLIICCPAGGRTPSPTSLRPGAHLRGPRPRLPLLPEPDNLLA